MQRTERGGQEHHFDDGQRALAKFDQVVLWYFWGRWTIYNELEPVVCLVLIDGPTVGKTLRLTKTWREASFDRTPSWLLSIAYRRFRSLALGFESRLSAGPCRPQRRLQRLQPLQAAAPVPWLFLCNAVAFTA